MLEAGWRDSVGDTGRVGMKDGAEGVKARVVAGKGEDLTAVEAEREEGKGKVDVDLDVVRDTVENVMWELELRVTVCMGEDTAEDDVPVETKDVQVAG